MTYDDFSKDQPSLCSHCTVSFDAIKQPSNHAWHLTNINVCSIKALLPDVYANIFHIRMYVYHMYVLMYMHVLFYKCYCIYAHVKNIQYKTYLSNPNTNMFFLKETGSQTLCVFHFHFDHRCDDGCVPSLAHPHSWCQNPAGFKVGFIQTWQWHIWVLKTLNHPFERIILYNIYIYT